MAVCLIIGAAVVVGGPAMKTATSKSYKNKVKAMRDEGKFEYIAIGEVTYTYTRPLRGTAINEPIYSSIAYMKQEMEGSGDNRILAVVRKRNDSVNFVMLDRSSSKKRFDKKNPLNSCSIDPNLKTNSGELIVASRDLKVLRKNANTFLIEDTDYRSTQTHRKVLEIQVKNTKRTPMGKDRLSGMALCELLNHMANKGSVPRDFPSISTRDCMMKDENKASSSSISSSSSSSSSVQSPVDENTSENEDMMVSDPDLTPPANDDAFVTVDSNEVISSDELDAVITIATATATSEEYDEDVIHVAMATAVE
ncbi:MAG: hypothetical protein ACI8RD_004992 [Bacillariaceae sp.]|jgi:hypothetical protein